MVDKNNNYEGSVENCTTLELVIKYESLCINNYKLNYLRL